MDRTYPHALGTPSPPSLTLRFLTEAEGVELTAGALLLGRGVVDWPSLSLSADRGIGVVVEVGRSFWAAPTSSLALGFSPRVIFLL